MSFNHLPNEIELLLLMCDEYGHPFSAQSIATILSFESKKSISWMHVSHTLHEALKMNLIERHNQNLEKITGTSIGYNDLFILSFKGKEYIRNLNFENERLNREKEALQVAKEASKKANISNIIAIISIAVSLFSFFYNNYTTNIQDQKAKINETTEINKLKLDK